MDNTGKRDHLINNERQYQTEWYSNNKFNAKVSNYNKFFVTFPYPYMNGRLHLGHAFTLLLADITCRYYELNGCNVLFPFGFHGSGMPIVASAKRLKHELVTNTYNKDDSQYNILLKMRIPDNEIPKFVDPYYWLDYFPKHAIEDLKLFGTRIDFSRTFITTDINPYYESFIKWQLNKLKDNNSLVFGKKHIIYSPKDKQPCTDHDRNIGEGVGVKEFLIIKSKSVGIDYVILISTTRSELLYGATNIWINPKGDYLIVQVEDVKYICSQNMLNNMIYQKWKSYNVLSSFKGKELINMNVILPSIYGLGELRILPANINMKKASGIICSVPAHSVFDYETYCMYNKSLFDKPNKLSYSLINFEKDHNKIKNVITVSNSNNYSLNLISKQFQFTIDDVFHKINYNKTVNRNNIKNTIDKEEHTNGILNIGDYKGMKIKEARDKITTLLIDNDNAFKYYEPDSLVTTRTGDECVVAYIDQWYINYGDEKLTNEVNNYIDNKLTTNNDKVKHNLKHSSNWIKEWSCSRSYGLGEKLLDTDYVIDSLSDSTIYMAFYTIAHLVTKLPKELLCIELWDFVFGFSHTFPDNLVSISSIIIKMKKEFQYWYPINLRVSGKDLISNHLTMSLYNHKIIWKKDTLMPEAYSVNGHILLNGRKMSKRDGNFITLHDAIQLYGTDPLRISLTQAYSGLDDANFLTKNAEVAVNKLYNELEWMKLTINQIVNINKASSNLNYWDTVFECNINQTFNQVNDYYKKHQFQKIISVGFFTMLQYRDNYRTMYINNVIDMNSIVMINYIQKLLLILYPICPHWSCAIWDYAKSKGLNINNKWLPKQKIINKEFLLLDSSINDTIKKCHIEYNHIIKQYNKNNKVCDPNNLTLEVKIYNSFSDIETDILNKTYNMRLNNIDDKTIINNILKLSNNKRIQGLSAKFAKYILDNFYKYGIDWYKWIKNGLNKEYDTLKKWLPIVLQQHKIKRYVFTIMKGNKESQFKFYPSKPLVRYY
jgi:leucyl-tRNA synthetase